ncbi:hypothetical protein D3C78_1305460 [compost metagenome]
MPGTPGGNRNDIEFLFLRYAHVHVAHRHQGSVFQLQARDVVGQGAHIGSVGFSGDQLAQFRAARVLVLHVFDEVRQFVTGVDTFEVFATVDVVSTVDQPVHVEHHSGVCTQFTGATADFLVPCNRRFTTAMVLAGKLRQIHRGYVADFRSQDDFAHDDSPEKLFLLNLGCGSKACSRMQTTRFLKDRSAFIAGKPCSHRYRDKSPRHRVHH